MIGHSLGGFVALKLAIDHPGDVGKLVIVDALPALGAVRMDSLTAQQLHDFAPQMRAQLMAQTPEAYAAGQAQTIASMVTAPADVARVQAWARPGPRRRHRRDGRHDRRDLRPRLAGVKAPTLVMGSWIAYKEQATLEADARDLRAPVPRAGGRAHRDVAGGPPLHHAGRPAWFEKTLEAFVQ